MDKIKLSKIDLENAFFHFTNRLNIESISEYGLLSTIGENSKGLQNTKKVFFAKGVVGALKNCDVWIKDIMNRMFGWRALEKEYQGQELIEMSHKWDTEFLSGSYLKDEAKKQKTFEKMFNDMRRRRYLILGLRDGIDFSYDDIDETKKHSLEAKQKDPQSRDYAYMKEFYGGYSNIDSIALETWNMHTFTGKSIHPRQITQLIAENGLEDSLSILIEMYDKYYNKDVSFDILDDFISYSKKRIKQDEKSYDNVESEDFLKLLERNGFSALAIRKTKEIITSVTTEQKDQAAKQEQRIQELQGGLYIE